MLNGIVAKFYLPRTETEAPPARTRHPDDGKVVSISPSGEDHGPRNLSPKKSESKEDIIVFPPHKNKTKRQI